MIDEIYGPLVWPLYKLSYSLKIIANIVINWVLISKFVYFFEQADTYELITKFENAIS